MRISLVVLTPGKSSGKVVPVNRAEFVIGRDAQCHLRPASVLISHRHCALLLRAGKAFVRDFGSTNGTFVNGRQIRGEMELLHDDRLKLGPLEFAVRFEGAAVTPAAPPPAPRVHDRPRSEDEIAAALLALDANETPTPGGTAVDTQGVPTGNTLFEGLPPVTAPAPQADAKGGGDKPAGRSHSDTTTAAREALNKYLQGHEMQKIRSSDRRQP